MGRGNQLTAPKLFKMKAFLGLCLVSVAYSHYDFPNKQVLDSRWVEVENNYLDDHIAVEEVLPVGGHGYSHSAGSSHSEVSYYEDDHARRDHLKGRVTFLPRGGYWRTLTKAFSLVTRDPVSYIVRRRNPSVRASRPVRKYEREPFSYHSGDIHLKYY